MRHEANLTQEQLSNITFIGRSTLSDYEREKTDINFDNIEKIAHACNYEILFVNKSKKNRILTSKNISREEI